MENNTKGNFENAGNNAKNTANEFKDGVNDLINNRDNKKVLAGLLGIFLGGFGIHKFVLGYTNEGIILLAIFLLSFPLMCIVIGVFTIYIPFIVGLIEGIIYLTKSDEDFYQTYQVGRKPWF